MKRLTLILFTSIIICLSFGQETNKLPEYRLIYDVFYTFQETFEGVVSYDITKEELRENINTFIYINKCDKIFESDKKIIFGYNDIPVSSEYLYIYVGSISRSKSEISFMVTIDILDSLYKYSISNIKTNRRAANINKGVCQGVR